MSAHAHPFSSFPRRTPRVGALAEELRRFWRIVRTRQDLANLDERMLRDIGVTPAQARAELNRAPWDGV